MLFTTQNTLVLPNTDFDGYFIKLLFFKKINSLDLILINHHIMNKNNLSNTR